LDLAGQILVSQTNTFESDGGIFQSWSREDEKRTLDCIR